MHPHVPVCVCVSVTEVPYVFQYMLCVYSVHVSCLGRRLLEGGVYWKAAFNGLYGVMKRNKTVLKHKNK